VINLRVCCSVRTEEPQNNRKERKEKISRRKRRNTGIATEEKEKKHRN